MTQADKKTVKGSLLGCGGSMFLMLAAHALYLGFISPLNRGKPGMAGGAVMLALLFGAPGAFLLYKASKVAAVREPSDDDDVAPH